METLKEKLVVAARIIYEAFWKITGSIIDTTIVRLYFKYEKYRHDQLVEATRKNMEKEEAEKELAEKQTPEKSRNN